MGYSVPNLIIVSQTVRAYVQTSAGKIGPFASRLSRSLKVIGTDAHRLCTFVFLLVIRGNHRPISYCFRHKDRYWWEKHMGFLPRVFNARAGDFYRKIFFATRAKETRELALPEGEKKFDDMYVQLFRPNTGIWQEGNDIINIAGLCCRIIKKMMKGYGDVTSWRHHLLGAVVWSSR